MLTLNLIVFVFISVLCLTFESVQTGIASFVVDPYSLKRFVHQEYLLVMMISWLQNGWPCYSKSLWSIAFRCCQTKLYNSHIWRKCFRMSSSRSNSIIIKYLFNFIHHGHWLCYFVLIMLNIHTSKTNFDHQLYMYKLLLCTSL